MVYVVSPVSEFNAYNVEAAPYYWLPVPDAEADGTLEAGTNMVVSGVCGEFYYAMLPDGTYFYIPQSAVAQDVYKRQDVLGADGRSLGF